MRLDKNVAPVDRMCLEKALDQFCVTVDALRMCCKVRHIKTCEPHSVSRHREPFLNVELMHTAIFFPSTLLNLHHLSAETPHTVLHKPFMFSKPAKYIVRKHVIQNMDAMPFNRTNTAYVRK